MDNLFRKYFNSVMRPGEFEKLSDFLRNPGNNAEISKMIKPLWDKALNSSEAEQPETASTEKMKRRIIDQEMKSLHKRTRIFAYLLRFAAIIIIGLMLSTLFFYERSTRQPAGKLQTVTTPYGARANLTLPDGSKVWLNSASSISYSPCTADKREVRLIGEAFFEVKKSEKSFWVHTNQGAVEVKGTVFNVRAYADEDFQTTLLSGTVKVSGAKTGSDVVLSPGQQAVVDSHSIRISRVDPELFSSWKDGKLIFRKAFLPEVARRLERWYNVKIELEPDQRLSEISYTGTLEMESFSEVLQLLKITAPIDFSYNEKTRVIRIYYKKS